MPFFYSFILQFTVHSFMLHMGLKRMECLFSFCQNCPRTLCPCVSYSPWFSFNLNILCPTLMGGNRFFDSSNTDITDPEVSNSSEFKTMPDGWETTSKTQDRNPWEMSQREEDILLQEFERRIAFSKFQVFDCQLFLPEPSEDFYYSRFVSSWIVAFHR